MFSILFEYPVWFVLFCVATGFGASWFLYHKETKISRESSANKKIKLLFVLRFVSIFLLALLLLGPVVKTLSTKIDKPIIVLAQDNSESLKYSGDSIFNKHHILQIQQEFAKELGDEYEVVSYTFGDRIKSENIINFTEKQTDISQIFGELKSNYSNRNLGALVLATDGIYNKGNNPINYLPEINYPVYTLPFGDTTQHKDICLSQIQSNSIAFLGNKFPVQITSDFFDEKGVSSKLQISNQGKVIFEKEITSKSDNYTEETEVQVDAKQIGLQRYTISISPAIDEKNIRNNTREIVVDVINNKQKILLLANSAHPDISCIRRVLDLYPNYVVDYSTLDKLSKPISNYNLIVLHQIPSLNSLSQKIITDAQKQEIPVLYILGQQSNLSGFNSLKNGLMVFQQRNSQEDAQATLNKQFSLFEIDEETEKFISSAPPLVTAFGEYKTDVSSSVLFFQKNRGVVTSKPLILFTNSSGVKSGIISGEGIWRWALDDFQKNQNNTIFNTLINKIIQYLSLKVEKQQFRVNYQRTVNENESVVFSAEIYNENYELTNDGVVTIEIRNAEEKKFNYTFTNDKSKSKTYSLNAGNLPVGTYSFSALAKVKGKTYTSEGSFSVNKLDYEAINTLANHNLLYQLSKQSGGKMIKPENWKQIIQEIKKNENIVPVSYSDKILEEVIQYKLLFFIILILLSAEWFLRKYWGSY